MEADITKAHYNFKEQIKISWRLEGAASQYLTVDVPNSVKTESK